VAKLTVSQKAQVTVVECQQQITERKRQDERMIDEESSTKNIPHSISTEEKQLTANAR